MSEKLSLWPAVKDNWSQVTVAVSIIFLLGGALADWRIGVKVDAAVAALEFIGPKDQKVIDMDSATATNTFGVATNKENIVVNRQSVERAFDYIMDTDR